MPEHQWAPPEHPDVTLHESVQFPLDRAGTLEPVEPDQPVWATIEYVAFDKPLRLKCFAIARSDTAVLEYTAWQGRRQEVLVDRRLVTSRTLAARTR